MSQIHVELHVRDFAPVRHFYCAFGFQVARDDPEYLVLRLGDASLRFWPGNATVVNHAYFGQFPADTPRGYGVEIVIMVDDLDAAYAVAQQRGAVVEELTTKPWGLRDFRAVDPYGYYLRFTEHHNFFESA